MEEEKEEIKKPSLDLEVKVEVKGIQKLENNMAEVKNIALSLQEYYKATKFIEEGTVLDFEDEKQMQEIEEKRKLAKDEKVKVNNFKKAINEKFKDAMEIYNKPIDASTKLKKETIDILTATYEIIDSQVDLVDEQMLKEKSNKVKSYFDEYLKHNNIDFVTYEQANINVTLSASMKSLKEQAKAFIDKVTDDLNLINTQEHKTEILVEYKQSLNVAQAITSVSNRIKAILDEQMKQEALEEIRQEEQLTIDTVDSVLSAPVEETQEDITTIVTAQFTVRATKEKLKSLITFLECGGYDYE